MEDVYHVPVLLKECIEGLSLKEGGVYVDVTFGGGGHTREILKHLKGGRVVVFDQDEDAYENRPEDERLIFVRHNFRYLKHFLKYMGIEKVDGILADLGVSSHHFDTPERGFSFRFEGELDMRMNKQSGLTAANVLNDYEEHELYRIFKNYGEIKKSGKLVRGILARRQEVPFHMISDLLEIAETCVPSREKNKFLAKVFQALRIEVNGEMEALKEMLMQTKDVLDKQGRLVVISYHSLEDRLVKNFMRTGDCEVSQPEQDFYGRSIVPFKAISRKPMLPSDEELERNTRSRSAKLRICEKM
ncbi:16S rRNA (cytosine(1402)-N(4))-methyltransferase RsmH [Saccharicrinis fermentans]|uniref:Ribosomal RNA small subunit methyltransferase H n=1 Tax=Saccharicrinis fermentans DSM 9555 = JCM 21142 TaxID=869213 RepID=W7Y533_9BACT|nr:16S rRNA (cytosine(1402)-N(4))-methyltransferase RsmH [Saccharicrinis fermentans]GAF02648.1 ribosomal RNA small subunit methyltransferase H [Saccharicrinis fermentans DSM 9555 = JCM 21142]